MARLGQSHTCDCGVGLVDPEPGLITEARAGNPLTVRGVDRVVVPKPEWVGTVPDGKPTGTLPGSDSAVLNVAIAPDGRLLAAGGRDGGVKVWEVGTGRVRATLHAHQGSALAVAFAPDGRTLATAGEDRQGKLWDLGPLADARP